MVRNRESVVGRRRRRHLDHDRAGSLGGKQGYRLAGRDEAQAADGADPVASERCHLAGQPDGGRGAKLDAGAGQGTDDHRRTAGIRHRQHRRQAARHGRCATPGRQPAHPHDRARRVRNDHSRCRLGRLEQPRLGPRKRGRPRKHPVAA